MRLLDIQSITMTPMTVTTASRACGTKFLNSSIIQNCNSGTINTLVVIFVSMIYSILCPFVPACGQFEGCQLEWSES